MVVVLRDDLEISSFLEVKHAIYYLQRRSKFTMNRPSSCSYLNINSLISHGLPNTYVIIIVSE